LRDLVKARDTLYSPFDIPKKQHPYPGKRRRARALTGTSKQRRIDNPTKQLKDIQRRIHHRILAKIELPGYMFGAVPGKNLVLHAERHVKNQTSTLVHMDISSFYPSISCHQVYWVWNSVLGCPPPIASLLTQLTTFERHLPQGAPTSAALANIFLASIYGPVCLACEESQLTITTWVDDLVFSGPAARKVMEQVRAILARNGLRLAPEKREILGSRTEKVVTGARIGKLRPRATHRAMSELRSAIHRLAIGLVQPADAMHYRRNLLARIQHIRSICAEDADKLMLLAEVKAVRLQQ